MATTAYGGSDQKKRLMFPFFLAIALLPMGCGPDADKANEFAALAQRQLDAGQLEAANQSIGQALAAKDDNPEIFMLSAKVALAANRPVDAFAAMQQALALDPSRVDTLAGMAQLAFQLGSFDDARHFAELLLVKDPQNSTGMLIGGLVDLARGGADAAELKADAILKLNRFDEGGLILKSRALAATGRSEQALGVLATGAAAIGDTFAIQQTRLEVDRLRGDRSALARDFTVLIGSRPDDAVVALDYLNFLYKTGATQEAREFGEKMISNPRFAPANLPRLVEIWREYDRQPLDHSIVVDLARTGTRLARLAAAEFLIETDAPADVPVLLKDLTGSDSVGMRARMLAAQGDTARAGLLAQSVLGGDRSQCDALLALSSAKLAQADRAGAIRHAQEATTECPEKWSGYIVAARAYASSISDIDRIVDSALTAVPQNPSLVRGLSDQYVAAGNIGKALAVSERLTQSAPSSLRGWQQLAAICRLRSDHDCALDAAAGAARAAKSFTLDPPPGTPNPQRIVVRARK